jgi:hypothetical protein
MISVTKFRLEPGEYNALILRLVGNDAVSGGGLPLPDAFRGITEYLIEQGLPVAEPELVQVVRTSGAIPLKERRILSIWGSWQAFTRDLLLVLKQDALVVYHAGHGSDRDPANAFWTIGSHFKTGHVYIPISVPERDLEIQFITHSPLEKEQRARKDVHLTSLRKLRAEIDADGLLLAETSWLFDRIITRLEKGGKPRSRGRPPTGQDEPLENEPDNFIMCLKCGEDKALTTKNFSQYNSRGKWYWNRQCILCDSSRSGSPGLRKKQVEDAVNRLSVDGFPPSGRAVARELGLDDDRHVRKYWDELAAEGKVPRRQKK